MSDLGCVLLVWLCLIASFVFGAAYGRYAAMADLVDTLSRYGCEMWPRVLQLKYEICPPEKDSSAS